jgi:hypothetical protein
LTAAGLSSPPWPRPANVAERVRAAGLQLLPSERIDYHIHSLLKVYYQGAEVSVPADIGIAPGEGISPLHTHDTTGVIHVESPQKADFTVGQLFAEWGVPLTGARVWVDGQPVSGAPESVVFVDQKVVVVSFGPPPDPIPTVYPTTAPSPAGL